MEQITLRIPVRTLAELEREAAEHDRTRSEHIRDVLASRHDTPRDAPTPERVRDLEQQLADCQRDLERVQNEKEVLIDAYQSQEQTEALVEYVEERESAGALQRAKWWVFGRE
jgi:TolA-binding protein